ncbi:MAG: metallophosphoesterase [candidate division KSB1 bacterium]|nr:metallophosphoesterase [candidate division KSB1 bacterium]MDZ7276038.1 metallophosphoesterase [candidate division KSB1 bacterium]MDZ7285680.1 metallophosphoesterase [candidate division KSB1 bacterium]MDZ7298712.1 metallophosphoesterase [candidate division KSB1 bacterium]MDZ7307539.1 metallophosphoesterase [candidate division KSB1 bacterium]
MRLLCITDIHSNRQKFEQILLREREPDLLLIGGDFTDFGPAQEAEALLDLALRHCPAVLAVAGNCDSAAIDDMLVRRGVSLHRRGTLVNGVGFFGLSAMPFWRGDMYEFTEQELDGFLAEGHAQVQGAPRCIMLTHPPPRATKADRTHAGRHVGSTAVRTWMDRRQPVLLVCGHIHEARSLDSINGTTLVNCGPARNGYYAVAELNETVTVELKQLA